MAVHAGDTSFRAAESLWQDGQVSAARDLLEKILVSEPAHSDAAMLLGKLLQGLGMLNAACDVMASHCRHLGMNAVVTLRCARFIQQCQRQALAFELCGEAFAQGSGSAELHVVAGNLQRELGRFGSARAHYLAALKAQVDLDRWFVPGALASLQHYETRAHDDFARLAAHFLDTRYSLHSRATSGLGLAKAYDDIGDHERAASTLRKANGLLQQAQPWSRSAWSEWLEARRRALPPNAALKADPDFVPIFIVGPPRSGTTLVATRLASHPDVRDRGEFNGISFIADRLHAVDQCHDADALCEAAAFYRAHAIQDDPPVRWYVDKDPHNFRYLDLISAMFPNARIIHCRRGRADTALSIWSQGFARQHYGFASDLVAIADFFEGHDRLMQHWHASIALPIHTVDYETLVSDPETTLEALRQFVGLRRPVVTNAAGAPMTIASASLWQARQPIYTSSVGRWKNYVPHVPELRGF